MVKEEISKEIKDYLELNENKKRIVKNCKMQQKQCLGRNSEQSMNRKEKRRI